MSAASTPGAAPARARILSRAAFETRMLLANGEQLLVSLILPSLALIGLTLSSVPDLGPGARSDLALAGALALCVVSTAFTGQAIGTGFINPPSASRRPMSMTGVNTPWIEIDARIAAAIGPLWNHTSRRASRDRTSGV